MKKSTIIISLALITMSLSAYAIINWKNENEKETEETVVAGVSPNFLYQIDSRFRATVTKERIRTAVSVVDIIPEEAKWENHPIRSMEVTVIREWTEEKEMGKSLVLNPAQLQILESINYSEGLKFYANCKHKDTGEEENYDLAYFLTVVPEKEAEYEEGKDAIISYLSQSSMDVIAKVEESKLQPGMINFTINTEGEISNVKLLSTSGYLEIDEKMIQLIKEIPGSWTPAENAKGEKVMQDLVFSYGKIGC